MSLNESAKGGTLVDSSEDVNIRKMALRYANLRELLAPQSALLRSGTPAMHISSDP